jgi:predicted RNA binding protein YcfA (HicA-like mRNA interferase family)
MVSKMTKREKLLAAIRNNPADVRFDDACKVAEWLGFTERRSGGSHVVFTRPGERLQLNFQNHAGKIRPYQADQLIAMIARYGDSND